MFYFLNDPEGPNLLVVVIMAVILLAISLSSYLFKFSSLKKLLLAVFIQAVAVILFLFELTFSV